MRSLRSRKALLGAALVLCSTVFAFAVAGADAPTDDAPPPAADPPPPSEGQAEPITDVALMPEPGDETGPLAPFDPPPQDTSDVPPGALTPEERVYVEANRNPVGWGPVQAGFGAASREAAVRAAAEAAANALGIAAIVDLGVTP